jgi:hypothetical protein
MSKLKILNRDLNLRIIKKRTLQSIFRILLNESNVKSRELDLHNRFIFDFFFKSNVFNSKILAIFLKSRFYSFNNYLKARFFYFFLNTGLFLYLQKEDYNDNFIFKYLFNSKKFLAVFFKNNVVSLNSINCFLTIWGFNLSFFNIVSFMDDFNFLENQKKEYLHEEGKKLFIRQFFLSKVFFVRLFERKYHLKIFIDILKFYNNNSLFQRRLGFNLLYFFELYFFVFYFYLFLLQYIFSIFYMFDFYFKRTFYS